MPRQNVLSQETIEVEYELEGQRFVGVIKNQHGIRSAHSTARGKTADFMWVRANPKRPQEIVPDDMLIWPSAVFCVINLVVLWMVFFRRA